MDNQQIKPRRSYRHSITTCVSLANNTSAKIESALNEFSEAHPTDENLYKEFAEIKATLIYVHELLRSHKKGKKTSKIAMLRLQTTLSQINQLLDKMGDFDIEIWRSVRVPVFQLDFRLKLQSEEFASLFWKPTKKRASDVIRLEDGKRFWLSCFGDKALFVNFDRFFAELIRVQTEEYSRNYDQLVKSFLDFTDDGFVSAFEFKTFQKWFGPVTSSISRIVQSANQGLLAGFVPALEATLILQSKTRGSYLIRFSKTHVGSYAITFVSGEGKIKHCLLHSVDSPPGLTLGSPPKIYSSLIEFVNFNRDRLSLPVVPDFMANVLRSCK